MHIQTMLTVVVNRRITVNACLERYMVIVAIVFIAKGAFFGVLLANWQKVRTLITHASAYNPRLFNTRKTLIVGIFTHFIMAWTQCSNAFRIGF